MNDSELDEMLRKAQVPERPEGHWEDFPREVARQATRDRGHPQRKQHSPVWGWAWGLGIATACLVIGFALGRQRGGEVAPAPVAAAQLTPEQRIFREVMAMFPDRLEAIVVENSQVRLVLSEKATVPQSPPLVVNLCKQGKCLTYITFSGQQIRMNGEVFEVLYGADGEVIVSGSQTVWVGSKSLTPETNGLEVSAHKLGEAHS